MSPTFLASYNSPYVYNDQLFRKAEQDNYVLTTSNRQYSNSMIEIQKNTDELMSKLNSTLAECDIKANKIESQ